MCGPWVRSLTLRAARWSNAATPKIRRRWCDIGRMSAAEKHEVARGSWREANTVQLVEEASDASPSHNTSLNASSSSSSSSSPTSVSFRTDEEALAYLHEESVDEAEEHRIPTTTLATHFFRDLAATADEEMDVERSAEDGEHITDAEREEEAREVHRNFFLDYYVQQGVLLEAERVLWLQAHQRPAMVDVEINTERPLLRLVLRDQVEAHLRAMGDAVFQRTADPLTYTMDMVPTTLSLPVDVHHSAPCLAGEVSACALPTSSLEENGSAAAEALSAWMNDDVVVVDGDESVVMKKAKDDSSSSLATLAPPSTVVATRPPSTDHVRWMQRQMSTNALIHTDVLARMASMIAVRCAAPSSPSPSPSSSSLKDAVVVLDLCSMRDGGGDVCIHRDVAHRLHRCQLSATCADERACLAKTVVAVVVGRHSTLNVDVLEEATTIVYVDEAITTTTSSSETKRSTANHVVGDVVLCMPRTSADGQRPRIDGWELDNDVDDATHTSSCVPHRFLDVCAEANNNFIRLRDDVRDALNHLHPRKGGWVMYATRSMNPIENEAVVCAAITEYHQQQQRDDDDVVAQRPCVEVVPLDNIHDGAFLHRLSFDEREEVMEMLRRGGPALPTWSAVEGGVAEQEPSMYAEELRKAVGDGGWRSSPIHGVDGGFMILLRQRPMEDDAECTPSSSSSCGVAESKSVDDDDASSSLHSHQLVFGGAAFVSEDGQPVSLMTSTCARWCQQQQQQQQLMKTDDEAKNNTNKKMKKERTHKDGWVVRHAGVLVGSTSRDLQHVRISSAISGRHEALIIQQMMLNNNTNTNKCASLALTLPILAELLRLRELRSRSLRGFLHRARKTKGDANVDASPPSQLIAGCMASVAPLIPTSNNPSAALHVFLHPTLGDLQDHLHEAVVEELSQVVVVAHLSQDGDAHEFRLSLSVPTTCAASSQQAGLEEACVGVRDALMYVMRRVGMDASPLLAHMAAASPHKMMEVEEAPNTRHTASSLEEDEYDVLGENLLSHGERHTRERRLQKMGQHLAQDEATDWAPAVAAFKRGKRQWRARNRQDQRRRR